MSCSPSFANFYFWCVFQAFNLKRGVKLVHFKSGKGSGFEVLAAHPNPKVGEAPSPSLVISQKI